MGLGLGSYLSIEWNLIRLGNPFDGIVTKTVYNTRSGVTFLSVKNWALCSYFYSDFFQIYRNSALPPLHTAPCISGVNVLPFDKQVFGGWVVNMGE